MEFELRRIRDEVMILMFAYHRRNKKNAQVQRSDQNYIIHCKKGEQMFIYTVYIYIYIYLDIIHTHAKRNGNNNEWMRRQDWYQVSSRVPNSIH